MKFGFCRSDARLVLLAAAWLVAAASPGSGRELVAIRVARAETISHGAIDNAVVLVEGGKIVAVGQDLPVERGIRTIDARGLWVMPGLVNAFSRLGMYSDADTDFTPDVSAAGELLARAVEYDDVLKAGVTTMALIPPGKGVAGQAVVVRTRGETRAEMLIKDPAFLVIQFESDTQNKKRIRDAFEKVDSHLEAVKKAREKFEKEQEKAKKSKKPAEKEEPPKDGTEIGKEGEKEQKSETEKGGEKEAEPAKPATKDATPAVFVAPEPEPEVVPFLELRRGNLSAVVRIAEARDWLHFVDAIGDEKFTWDLRIPVDRDVDIFHVADKIGEKKLRVVMEPQISWHPGTMRQRNIPAELSRAGARLVLVPRTDRVRGHEDWLRHVGEITAVGLPRDVALKAVTLEAAELIGVGERLGSLDAGKDANLVFFDGDPLEVGTEVTAVMLEGEFVFGDIDR